MINNSTGDPPIIKDHKPIPYQLCPKCNGEGMLKVPLINQTPTYIHRTCDLCNGAKVILMYQP